MVKKKIEPTRIEETGVGQAIVMKSGNASHSSSSFLNSDNSWNMNNPTIRAVLKKHDDVQDPMGILEKSPTSKLMDDKGHRLDVADTIIKLGRARPRPTTEDELVERLYEYFGVCQYNKVPPTYPLFSVWCGMSIEELEKHHARVYNLKNAVALCRETIRGFLELSAMDNALSPLIYFHQQKVYFGAVETAKIQVEEVRTEDEQLKEIEQLIKGIKPLEGEVMEVID